MNALVPGINLGDPKLDNLNFDKREAHSSPYSRPSQGNAEAADDRCHHTGVDALEQIALLDMDFDVSGQISYFVGLVTLQRIREQCWRLLDDEKEKRSDPSLSTPKQTFSSVKPPPSGSKLAAALENSEVLPSKNIARQFVAIALSWNLSLATSGKTAGKYWNS